MCSTRSSATGNGRRGKGRSRQGGPLGRKVWTRVSRYSAAHVSVTMAPDWVRCCKTETDVSADDSADAVPNVVSAETAKDDAQMKRTLRLLAGNAFINELAFIGSDEDGKRRPRTTCTRKQRDKQRRRRTQNRTAHSRLGSVFAGAGGASAMNTSPRYETS